jgi:hypothetical protein
VNTGDPRAPQAVLMTVPMSRDVAATAVAAAVSERDTIQANLLDLDASFGKRLLDGATLTGTTQQRWATVSADLTSLWETFHAYSAVVDRAAELAAGRLSAEKLAEITGLLTGQSVQLARPPAPIGQRELTAGPAAASTMATAVVAMRRAYARGSSLCADAEAIWTEISDGLQQASTDLDRASQQAAGLADRDLASALAEAQENLRQLRNSVNADPLALGPARQPDSPGPVALVRLRKQVASVAARAAELNGLRTDGSRRLAALTAAVAAARAARQDATVARQRAAVRLTNADPAPLADAADLERRLATVRDLQAAGRLTRLATELGGLEKDVTAAERAYREAERVATAGLDERNALRGMLDAYQAKAAALGGAESTELIALYSTAKDALWIAPCDLDAAAAAVTSYQQAVLALGQAGGRP